MLSDDGSLWPSWLKRVVLARRRFAHRGSLLSLLFLVLSFSRFCNTPELPCLLYLIGSPPSEPVIVSREWTWKRPPARERPWR